MSKLKPPDLVKSETAQICRFCLEKRYKFHKAKHLESFLYFVLPELDLSLLDPEEPLICLQCIQQLTDSYIFKSRCMYNQDQIIKLKNMLQRPISLEEVVQGTDFHKENEQTSEIVYNSLKTLLGREFDGTKTGGVVEEVVEGVIEEEDIEYYCEEEVSDNGQKGLSYSELSNVRLEESQHTNEQTSIENSELVELGEVEINCFEEYVETSEECANTSIDHKGMQKEYSVGNSSLMSVRKIEHESEGQPDVKRCKKFLPSSPTPNGTPNGKSGKPYACTFCYKQFSQKLHSDGHLLAKHKDVPNIEAYVSSRIHYCQFCPYRTINSYNLSSHIVTKHGKTQHDIKFMKCELCDYSTHNRGNFSIHVRRHDKVKPFVCKLCKKRYGQKINLDCHYLNGHGHEEDIELLISSKVYACTTCSFKSVDKQKYHKHVVTQHTQGDYVKS